MAVIKARINMLWKGELISPYLQEFPGWRILPKKRYFPKQCGNTWGFYGSSKKPGSLDRGGGRGSVQNSSLFSWFRACMSVSSVNFRSFGVAATDGSGFCL